MRIDPSFAGDLIRLALKKGADQAEVYMRVSRTVRAEVRGGEPDAIQTERGQGFGMRVIKGGRLGFSWANSPEARDRALNSALETAELTACDPALDLPEPASAFPDDPEIFDPSIENATESDAIEIAKRIEASARGFDRRVNNIRMAMASLGTHETYIANSKGLSAGFRSTGASGQVMAVAEEEGDSRMGWGYAGARFLADLDAASIGADAARRAVMLLRAGKLEPVKSPIILDRMVAAEFIGELTAMLSAETVQKGKSPLAGKLGQRVASEVVNVVDDGLIKRAPGSRSFDDEGVPVCRKALIEGGILKGYMHNTYTARKDGALSTGNAMRGGYAAVPSVGPMNLILETRGDSPAPDALMERMGKGLYVLEAMGVHTINPISGDFSVGVSGIWIEGGKPARAVAEAVISGNLIDLFSNVQALAGDFAYYGSVGCPSVMFGPTDISA